MKLIKMNYKGYEFNINPSTLKLAYSKNIANQNIIDGVDRLNVISMKGAVITGTGILVGDDMLEQMSMLQMLFDKKESDYLFLPAFSPIKVYFTDLEFEMNNDKSVINYSFKFIEDSVCKKDNYCSGYTIAKNDENLFDIANRLGISVDVLVENNDFDDLFSVNEGDKVYYA